MTRSSILRALAFVVVVLPAVNGLRAADKPRLPAQAAAEPADTDAPRLGGLVDFTPPEGWELAKKSSTPTRRVYVNKTRDGMMSVELLPASAKMDATMAPKMMEKMRQNRQANGQKVVQEPTLEKDDRFVIRIRERYEVKDKVADQLHLYRAVGPRMVMVTVNSLAEGDTVKEHHAAGENAAMSAEMVEKAKKG